MRAFWICFRLRLPNLLGMRKQRTERAKELCVGELAKEARALEKALVKTRRRRNSWPMPSELAKLRPWCPWGWPWGSALSSV